MDAFVKQDRAVTAFAPATVANVVCGFDVFGFAVHDPGDTVRVRWSAQPSSTGAEVLIREISGDQGRLSLEGDRNTAGVAIVRLMESLGISRSVELEIRKGLPLGSGMGSSAASAVAALVGFNELAGLDLSRRDLLPFAMEAERMACGSAHADNAAPGLLGGFVLVRDYHPLDVISIPFPESLAAILVHPDIELKTRDARSVLRDTILLRDAVGQWGNTAGMVAGLMQGDFDLVSRCMVDRVAEPVRGLLIPGYGSVCAAARAAGAIGAGISGSGPTLFALCSDEKGDGISERIGQAMQQAFSDVGLSSTMYRSKLNSGGARILLT